MAPPASIRWRGGGEAPVASEFPVGVSLLGVPRLRPAAAESENVHPQRSVQTGSWRRSRERGERQAEGGRGDDAEDHSDGAARGRPLPLLTHTTPRQPIRALPIPGRPVLPRRAAAPRLSPAVVRRCCRRRSRRRRARRDAAAAAAAASLDICSQGWTRRSAAAPCWRTPASPAVPAITHFL